MKAFLLTIAAVVFFVQIASARFVTLISRVENGTNFFQTLSIGTNEVAELRSFFEYGFQGGNSPLAALTIQKGGQEFGVNSKLFLNTTNAMSLPLIVAGPATVKLENVSEAPAFATLEVKTEAFPPDKTLIVPGDSNGANVIMESSTDLVNWSTAMPGTYTNRTNNLFFRIRAERLP